MVHFTAWRPLPDAQHPALRMELAGQTSQHHDCAYSPDGKTIATAGEEGVLCLWDAKTGKVLHTLIAGERFGIWLCAFSPDGTRIAGAWGGGAIVVWDVSSGKEVARTTQKTYADSRANKLSYSPDGRYLLLVAGDPTDNHVRKAFLLDAVTLERARTFPSHDKPTVIAVFSPDGQYVATGGDDHMIRVWDAQSGVMVAEHAAKNPDSLAFSFGSKYIAYAGWRTIGILNWRGSDLPANHGATEVWQASIENTERIECCVYHPNGTYLAVAISSRIALYDPIDGRLITTTRVDSDGVNALAFSPDGKTLMAAALSGIVRLYDVKKLAAKPGTAGLSGGVWHAAFSVDGSKIAVVEHYRTAFYNADTGTLERVFDNNKTGVTGIALSPDGQRVFTTNWSGEAKLADTQTGSDLFTARGDARSDTTIPSGKFYYALFGACYSPDGRYVGAGGENGVAFVWDGQTGELQFTVRGHVTYAERKAEEDSGGEPIDYCEGFSVNCLQFSPDGKRLVTTADDKTVRVWYLEPDMNGNPSAVSIHVLRGHTDPVCSAVFSSDGNFIASASTDNTVRIWSAETGRLLHTLNGHDAPPCAVAFTPNGTRLLSSGRDGQLIVWDVRTGAQLAVHEADGELHDVTIHPDGTHVVAAGAWGLYWLDLVD